MKSKNSLSSVRTKNSIVKTSTINLLNRLTHIFACTVFLLCFVQNGWGQIAQRGSSTNASNATTNNTTITINKPTGVVAGDVLLFSVVQNETDNDNGGLSSPALSGWTLVKDILIRSDGTSNNNNAWFGSIYYRISDGSEGASFTFAMNSRCDMAIGSMVAFSGVATNALKPDGSSGGPFDVVPSTFNNANASTATATGLTVANNNSALLMIGMVSNDRTYSSWSNSLSELFDHITTNGDDASIGAAWTSCNLSGATENRTVTISSSDQNSAILLALRSATVVTISLPSSTPTLCINTALTNITHTTTGATGISNSGVSGANGLPAGVSASWASNTITISGTPTASGTFNYSIPLTGGCGSVNATGTITVNTTPNNPTAPATQTFCQGATVADLVATGTNIKWYPSTFGAAQLASNTVLSSGVYFVTQSTSCGESSSLVSAGLSNFGSDESGSFNRGVVFDLTSPAILQSFQVESDAAGDVTFTLTNTGSNVAFSKTITTAIVSGVNTINVASWGEIPAGTNYKLLWTARSNNSIDLTRTENFSSFPLPFGIGSITGNNETNFTRYHYFYNLIFQVPSGGRPVSVRIDPKPTNVLASSSAPTICLGNTVNLQSSTMFNNPSANLSMFNGGESTDNWSYTGSTGVSLTTVSKRTGENSIRLTGSDEDNVDPSITFNNVQLSGYTNVQLSVAFAALDVDGGDDLFLDLSYNNGLSWTSTKLVDGFDNFDNNFDQVATTNSNNSGVFVSSNPFTMNIPSSESQILVRIRFDESGSDNRNDFYYIDDVTLTGTPIPGSLAWSSNPSGFTSSLQNPTGVSPSATTTYTVTATNSYGCASSANTTVTVNTPTLATTPTTGVNVWTGRISNNYNALANWSVYDGNNLVPANTLPAAATNVIIPAQQACIANSPSALTSTVFANNITIETGANLSLGTGELNIHGNYTNNGTLIPENGTVVFTGLSGNQTITKNGGETFTNLTVNKNSGSVVLANLSNSPITITGALTLTKGLVQIGANDFIMGNLSSLNGGSELSYIQTSSTGSVKRTVSAASSSLFPIGKGTYNPIQLTKIGASHSFGARVVDQVTANGLDNGPISTGANAGRMWDITPAAGYNSSQPVTVSLFYKNFGNNSPYSINNHYNAGFSNSPADRRMFHFGGTWEDISDASFYTNSTDTLNGFIYCRQSGVSDFSPFTVSNFSAVLPIELVSFQANCTDDNTVSVTWSTASEHNTSHYVVEKSRDGQNWSVLGVTGAAFNSTELLNYEMIDVELSSEVVYYRLTQYDNDGQFEVFNVVALNCEINSTNTLTTYPNPSENNFYLNLFTDEMEGNGQIIVLDGNGRVVYTKSVLLQNGNNVILIDDMNAEPGIYYIKVSNETTTTYIVKHSLR